MIKKFFNVFLIAALVYGVAGCMSDEETEDEKLVKKEEALIQNYLSQNGITNTQPLNFGIFKIPGTTTTGAAPVENDVAVIEYEFKTLEGALIGNNQNSPTKVKVQYGTILPYSIPLLLISMKEGEEATFLVPSTMVIPPTIYSRFADYNFNDQIVAGKPVIIKLKLVDIISAAQQLQMEKDTISAYVKEHNLEVQQRASGLFYIKQQEGTGAMPAVGTTVSTHYTLRLMDSTVVETTTGNNAEPFNFVLSNNNQLYSGWNEAISLMKKGEKSSFIMPSYLTSYFVVIPENMKQDMITKKFQVGALPQFVPVMFEIHLVDIK